MKKILSLVLAAMMVLTMAPAVFADEVVEDASQYQEAIDFLANLGIWKGTENGDAALEGVQRWQMANFVARVTTGYTDDAYWATPENDSGFDDIDIGDFAGSSETAYGTISYAAQKGIVRGVSDTKFAPADGITYRDAQTMLVRALGFQMSGAAYPWGFITKAQELGLTEGLSGIGHTDELNRGQVAQLIYNALFVEVEGKTLAQKAFALQKNDVIITASNRVVYTLESLPVLKTGYIRYSVINAQGEPTVNEYHAPIASFGLADSKAADAAVGTLYTIYHNDDNATIFSAESLSKTYWNYGWEEMPISASSAKRGNLTTGALKATDYYLKIAGVGEWVIVDAYTDLSRKQGETSDQKGSAEIKVYSDKGGYINGINNEYIIASNGDIYRVGDIAVDAVLAPWLVYSSVMDAYYGRDLADGGNGLSWRLYSKAEVEQILKGAAYEVEGFGLLNNDTRRPETMVSNHVSAYTKVVVSANERATIREYKLGKYTTASETYVDMYVTSQSNKPTFTITYTPTSAATTAGFSATEGGAAIREDEWTTTDNTPDTEHITSMYSFTGKTPASGDYILYYLNTWTRELEVIEIINANTAKATGNYIASGYLRSYDANLDTITLENSIAGTVDQYTIGYDKLEGSPLKTKTSTTDNIYNNITAIRPLINSYVNVLVIDNKVVHIYRKGDSADLVIIDKFTDFAADGIHALAYTTVDDMYDEIVIGSYNGWSVAGYEYSLYYLSGLFPGMNQYQIPLATDTFYTVVYTHSSNGTKIYNLTDCEGPMATNFAQIGVNKYNYIFGTNGSVLGADKYISTNASDYWLIVDRRGDDVVYQDYKGALKPEVIIKGADIYKVSAKDYVLVLDGDDTIVGLNNIIGSNTQYVVWNDQLSGTTNNYWLNPNSAYNWTVIMNNLFDGTNVTVTIDPALVNACVAAYGGWNGLRLLGDEIIEKVIGLLDGRIYKIADGVLYTNIPATIAEAAEFYGATEGYIYYGSVSVPAGSTLANVQNLIKAEAVKVAYPSFIGDTTALQASLTADVYARHANYGYLVKNNTAAVTKVTTGTATTVHFITNKAGKSIAWLFGETATAAVEYTMDVARAGEGVKYNNHNDDAIAHDVAAGYEFSATAEYLAAYGKLVVTLESGEKGIAFDAAADEIVVYTAESGDVIVTDIVVEGGKFVSATVELAGATDTSKVVVQVNRAADTEVYYEYTPA